MLLAGPASANINIVFDYTYDTNHFFGSVGSTQRTIMEAAANVFESRITDTLGAITPGGTDFFTISFRNPSATNNNLLNLPFSVNPEEITIFLGARSMSGGALGEGGPGGFLADGSAAFVNSVSRGQPGYTPQDTSFANETDFAPWGGSIAFNSTFGSWYFDSNLNTANDINGYDFYSVAVHEIAHVLGIGTADSWNQKKSVSGTTLIGPNSGTVALSSDGAHWQDGTHSTINGQGSFEAAMDPTLSNNTRKNLTDLDWNGLRDVGWVVSASPVPEPETWALLLAGLGLVGFGSRKRPV